MTVTPIDDGVIVFLYDIDIIKRAQQKIAYSEALLREAEKTGNVGSYELDVATGQIRFSEGCFIY
jgi:predicted RNA polymerase sigma factor